MIEAEPEPVGDVLLDLPHPRAIRRHRLARLGRGQLRRRAMLVGGADEQHLMPARPRIARIDIRRQLAAHQIAEMLDAVDVGQGGGDQDTGHGAPYCFGTRPGYAIKPVHASGQRRLRDGRRRWDVSAWRQNG